MPDSAVAGSPADGARRQRADGRDHGVSDEPRHQGAAEQSRHRLARSDRGNRDRADRAHPDGNGVCPRRVVEGALAPDCGESGSRCGSRASTGCSWRWKPLAEPATKAASHAESGARRRREGSPDTSAALAARAHGRGWLLGVSSRVPAAKNHRLHIAGGIIGVQSAQWVRPD